MRLEFGERRAASERFATIAGARVETRSALLFNVDARALNVSRECQTAWRSAMVRDEETLPLHSSDVGLILLPSPLTAGERGLAGTGESTHDEQTRARLNSASAASLAVDDAHLSTARFEEARGRCWQKYAMRCCKE